MFSLSRLHTFVAARFTTFRTPRRIGLAGLVVPGLAALWIGVGRDPGEAGPTAAQPPADTAVLYGPVTFATPTGDPQTFVETFTASVPMGGYQALRIVNGEPGGSGRVATLSLRLNGSELITGAFDQTVAALEVPVTFLTDNTLEVTPAGQAGAGVTVTALAEVTPRVTVYGPTQFVRQSGPPRTVIEHFSLPAGAAPPESLVIVNGNPDGTHRISAAWIRLNGQELAGPNEFGQTVAEIRRQVSLVANNELSVRLASTPGAFLTIEISAAGGLPPVVHVTTPAPGAATADAQVTVTGTVDATSAVTVTVNGQPATVGAGNSFEATVALGGEGPNPIEVVATDAQGRTGRATRTIVRDLSAPLLTVSAPQDGLVTSQTSIVAIGTVTDLTPTTVNVNGFPLVVDTLGGWSGVVSLSEGANVLTFTATDAAGNGASVVRIVTRDTQAPVLVVAEPEEGVTTTADSVTVSGTVEDLTAVTVTANGQPLPVAPDSTFSGAVAVALGPNLVTVIATDAAGNADSVERSVTRLEGQVLPPDPSTVAPPVDPTVATTLFAATEFLYTGANPIQTGVAPGTINPVRVSVIRGRVLDRSDAPLSGVSISVLNHPELGGTLSRVDGRFDLAVNGGGVLTLDYQKSGWLPAQRQVDAPWQDYVIVDDVVLVQLDPVVTQIDFSDSVQVARGSVVSDTDGVRQATLLFFQGTQAQMVFPNDSVASLASLSVRATEYTVGPNGPQAMPAILPPTSGYTYAVELSADEALAAGAVRVDFSQPVVTYVENFLGFPVGMAAPVGSYDRGRGVWVPEDNGRVIEVLEVTGGIATLDTDGDQLADDSTQLAALGITTAERQTLAGLYGAGQQLWRVPVSHFSPIDVNLAAASPPGAGEEGGQGIKKVGEHIDEPCQVSLSVIECQNQVLGERVAVVGTPFRLTYRSDRTPGFTAGATITVPVTGTTLPPWIRRVDVRVSVAGRDSMIVLPPDPNQRLVYRWDGRDAYGRQVFGEQPATVNVAYVAPELYVFPAGDGRAFGMYCWPFPGIVGETDPYEVCVLPTDTASVRREVTTGTVTRSARLGPINLAGQGLGGWSLDVHHAYDPVGRSLYLGTGERRAARDIRSSRVVAGNGDSTYAGDGGPATAASLITPEEVAVGPDGSVYVVDRDAHVIRRVAPDGIITTVAGTGTAGFSGDGGLATAAQLNTPLDVAVGVDGSLYIADAGNSRIRRVGLDGIVGTFAGDGTFGSGGDGGPAVAAQLAVPGSVTAAPDGSVYIGDDGDFPVRVRKVSPDGRIATVMGADDGPACTSDSLPAGEVCLGQIQDLVWGPDNGLYVLEGLRLWRVAPDGRATIVAGDPGAECVSQPGDGGLARAAGLCATSVAVQRTGEVFLADNNERVRVIEPGGTIATFGTGPCAGGGIIVFLAADLPGCLRAVALAPDGTLLVVDPAAHQVRQLGPVLPGYAATTLTIAAEDGSEVYLFDPVGRHLETRDALTGALRFRFGYNPAGRLVTIADADSNVTTIERDGAGNATAIVAPFRQRTAVAVDANGWLASITNPAGETVALTHDFNGLLVAMASPRSDTTAFSYDAAGFFIREDDPAGGSVAVARNEVADTVTVEMTTGEGRTTTYRVTPLEAGAQQRVTTSPAGLDIMSLREPDAAGGKATVTTTSPDGTVTTVIQGRDPRFPASATLDSMEVRTPFGLVSAVKAARAVQLADPNNPLTLVSQVDTLTVNGRTFVKQFDVATRTFTGTTPEGRPSSGLVDSLGRVIAEVVPGVDTVKYTYDAQGRLAQTVQGPRTWRYTYDLRGRLDSVIDPLLRATTFAYDSAGRVVSQRLPDGRVVGYGYDANGNPTQVTPQGRPGHGFTYTPVDLTASYNPPAVAEGTTPTGYEYNLDRQLTRILRPDGDTVRFTYDSAGRPQAAIHRDGSLGYTYTGVGNLATVVAPAETLAFSYDGSLLTAVTWSGAISGDMTAVYDNDFRVSELAVNGSPLATFGYDGDGLLTQAGDLAIQRDALNGRVNSTFLGVVTTGESYDQFGQWAERTARAGSTELYRAEYTRDALGRITGLVEVAEGDTSVFAYDYDDAGRLIEVQTNGVVTGSYEYDDNGNRLSVTRPSGVETGTYDAQDRLLSYAGATYGYTRAGERRFKAEGGDTTFYRYDALGNLLEVNLPDGTDIEYVVDGFNRRVGKKVSGVLVQGFLYQDQINPVAELDGSGNVVSRFVYGTRANVPDYMIVGTMLYQLVTDQLGSVRLVLNAADGTIVQRIAYDEFGRELLNTNPGFQPFGYAGGPVDEATGLVRFGARDYDALPGRWVNRASPGLGVVQTNPYSYVANDPVRVTDPLGLDPCWLGTAAGDVIVDQSIAIRTRDFLNDAVALGWGGGINESFRTTQQQTRLSQKPPPGTPIVATPGTSSHEAGFALDLDFKSVSCGEQKALLRAAATHGFTNTGIRGEPWHFFAGTYGPYPSKTAAILHNQAVVEKAGGVGALPFCITEIPWKSY
ncbi:MAG TPA: RHS repeat-associated core domain-containing protein [Gemmatimonadales bacterium]|nr:RHS repeat-associated core domain-containing protein [Gemmatimonadales bacterium]